MRLFYQYHGSRPKFWNALWIQDMRYKEFNIENFKGIKSTSVKIGHNGGPNVYAFVGLNESGKTTILEAIHSFSPDTSTKKLLSGQKGAGVSFRDRVPRHKISNFTGACLVQAILELDNDNREYITRYLKREHNIILDSADIPNEITLSRRQIFKNGDFQRSELLLDTELLIKTPPQRKKRLPDTKEERQAVWDAFYRYTPDIAYFPTFIFDFPREVLLTNRNTTATNQFYRDSFQDVLDYDGQGHTVEESLLDRIQSEDLLLPWQLFFDSFHSEDYKSKIDHVMDRAGSVLTEVIFGRWNTIFGEDTRGKEVIVSYKLVPGIDKDAQGVKSASDKHDIALTFQIRDGTRRFDINDRSLGFRWFFAFMLFTQFRVAREGSRPILFLFDEPASNLHAAAQQKLIESFPQIARGPHVLAYTTHSHYMIDPRWLEQTFIVTNRADSPETSILDTVSLDDESLDVTATNYSQFVNKNPGKTSYFQPVMDRLKVVPSRFDIDRAIIILEGRSDYYILEYAGRFLKRDHVPLTPALGAGTFDALISLSLGWGLKSIALLDSDTAGVSEVSRYSELYPNFGGRVFNLSSISPAIKEIEHVLDDYAKSLIISRIDKKGKLTKKDIRRFFQESIAKNEIIDLGERFNTETQTILESLEGELSK